MAGTTPNYGIEYGDDNESIGPERIQALAESIEAETMPVLVFDDADQRLATLPFPQDGQMSWLRNVHRQDVYRNGTWAPVHPVLNVVGGLVTAPLTGSFRIITGAAVITPNSLGEATITYASTAQGSFITAVAQIATTGGLPPGREVQVGSGSSTSFGIILRDIVSDIVTAGAVRINYTVIVRYAST